jgi:hypothetical protein
MKSKKRGCFYFLLLLIAISTIILSTMNINTIGLKALSFFKKISKNEVNLTDLQGAEDVVSHKIWNELLQKNVSPTGQVNYKGFLEDRDTFQQYLTLLTDHPPNTKTWTKDDQLAYWINAYNAFTVELILQHYPIESIKKIGGSLTMVNSAWDLKFFKIGGIDFDLNTIEHEILRKQFNEPRIHFAVNCASVSCPILLNEAFTGTKVRQQLKDRAVYFINNSQKNQLEEKAIKISGIFNWFEADFTKNGSLIDFLNQYAKVKIQSNATIEFLPYDWNLNE